MSIPQKVKIQLGRSARGVLLCRYNLRQRHVQCPAECPWCEDAEESEWHLFFGCPQAESVWRQVGLWNQIQHVVMDADGYRDCVFEIGLCIWNSEGMFVKAKSAWFTGTPQL